MEFGVGYFPTDDGIPVVRLARMLEARGQDAVLFAEHSHIPVGASVGEDGTNLPQKYWHCLDLFVALTAAAGATTRLRVGSGVCLVVERDPITTANAVASVDHISGGRLEFGVGAGWNRDEMRNHGTDPRTRMALLRERVEAMKQIWTQDEASYTGRFVSFDRIRSYPKPVQRPYPPVLVGGDGPTVLDRVLGFGDGWIPNYRGEDTIFARVRKLRDRADRQVEVQMLSVPADPRVLEQLHRADVRRALHWLPSGPRGVVEPALDRWEAAIGEFTGG